MNPRKTKRHAIVEQSLCVACGCCVKVCPLGAIKIVCGVSAQINPETCVGCGKCEQHCPQHIAIRRELKAVCRHMETPVYKVAAKVLGLVAKY